MMGLLQQKALLTATVLGCVLFSSAALAQQSMTVEELEAYIEKKKSELTEALAQRDQTAEKQAALEAQRAEQVARQERLEKELRELCDEREEAEPGSLDGCLKEMNLPAQ